MLRSIIGYRSRPTALFLRSSAISAHYSSSSPQYCATACTVPVLVKLNTDGSSLGNPGLAGAAGINRDSAGHVHLAYQFALGTGTSVLAELTAVWRGLELALTHGLTPLVVEVDATTVISLLQSRASGKWESGVAALVFSPSLGFSSAVVCHWTWVCLSMWVYCCGSGRHGFAIGELALLGWVVGFALPESGSFGVGLLLWFHRCWICAASAESESGVYLASPSLEFSLPELLSPALTSSAAVDWAL
ncbi:UNVERIFIED_CONTAM: putative ribonuclease H protein [Sesamum calycinum]|uniref:Ribonuclease H protein n=1 Tax=Sesamum calycinum TaxID=2727403 RepID=A0AAW2JFV0_9LAMI